METEAVTPVLIAPGGVFDARGQWHPVEALQALIAQIEPLAAHPDPANPYPRLLLETRYAAEAAEALSWYWCEAVT